MSSQQFIYVLLAVFLVITVCITAVVLLVPTVFPGAAFACGLVAWCVVALSLGLAR